MKRLISIISVIALLCTMFSLPVMAEEAATNVVAKNYTQVHPSNHKNDNAAAYGFTAVADANHVTADKNMGTHANNGTYYNVFEADAFAAPKPVAAIFGEAAGKMCINFTPFNSIWKAFKAVTYGTNDRMFFSTYVNNLDGKAHDLSLMPSSGGVNMTKPYTVTLPKNMWTKVDVVYDPNVTFTYTVDGVSKTVSTLGKTLPQNGNLGYATSSAGDANAETKWTPILALDGSTYDANSTYVISKVQFGEYRLYINGELVHKSSNAASYKAGENNFYFYDVVPSRFVLNKDGALAFSNTKFGVITNFDAATYSINQPAIPSVEGKFTVKGGEIFTAKGSISKADITAPEGTVLKVYSKDSDVTAAGGYKYTEVTEDTLPLGTIVTVQEDKDGGERISYIVSEDKISEKAVDATAFTSVGNATAQHVAGVAGKTADDKAAVLMPNGSSADAFFVADYGMTADQIAAFNGYMHLSFNSFMENTDDNVWFRLSSDTGASVAANSGSYTASKIFNSNQWNKVDIIIKLEGGKTSADAGKPNGLAKTYVNGRYIGETKTLFGGYVKADRKCTALRIGINSQDTADRLWIDDYKVVYTYGEPEVTVMPEAVTANIGDSVETITAQGARVYADASCKKAVTSGVLAHGNVIVKEENGMYVYSNIKNDDIKSYMTSSDTIDSRVRYTGDWNTAGIGGKAADDYNYKLVKHAVADDASDVDKANYVNFYPQFTYNRGENAKDYVVIGFNLYVPAESLFTDVGIYSQQHSNLGTTVGSDYLARNKWNSLMAVIDYTGEKATTTMYLNGNVYGTADREIGQKAVKNNEGEIIERQDFGGSIFNQIRLSVRTGSYKDTSVFYMDDIIVFETDEKFVPGKLDLPDTFKAKYDVALGDNIYVAEGEELTVAEIKADFANAVVTRDGAVLEDDAVIAKNDVIFLEEVANYVQGLAGYKALVCGGNTFGSENVRMFKPSGNTTLNAGDKIIARLVSEGVLAVAAYDAEGAMISVDSDMVANANYREFRVPAESGKVSFIGFESIDSLKPVCKNHTVSFRAN